MKGLNISSSQSMRPAALIILCCFTLILAYSTYSLTLLDSVTYFFPFPSFGSQYATRLRGPACSPVLWSDGAWFRKRQVKEIKEEHDVYMASEFWGCASNVNVNWHLGLGAPETYGRRTNVSAWFWWPFAEECRAISGDFAESLLVDLVERGGWLLIGDSVTEEHFFSLSCTLYPHIIDEPNLSHGKHDWPQHLHLNPESPLVRKLKLPKHFDIATTPIVSFRRNDLLMNESELYRVYRKDPLFWSGGKELFGDQITFNFAATTYIEDLLLGYLPSNNYRTLILSTSGHWNPELFKGLAGGYTQIMQLFVTATKHLLGRIERALDSDEGRGKQVVYRPYPPGDWGCHDLGVAAVAPLAQPPTDLQKQPWNWGWIPLFNRVWKDAIATRAHPRIHYVGIDRPGRLRPDAHVLPDCLHLTVGAGVIEDWSRYIHYFLANLE